SEPEDWAVSATDSTAKLQAPGGVGLRAYLSGSATNAPIFAMFDDLWAGSAGSEPPNAAPVAAFELETDELAVSVDGSGSSDPDGQVTSYVWDFGDGGSATGVTASHTYAEAGTYEVTLTVTDDAGATAEVTREVTVAGAEPPNAAPVAAFELETD